MSEICFRNNAEGSQGQWVGVYMTQDGLEAEQWVHGSALYIFVNFCIYFNFPKKKYFQ